MRDRLRFELPVQIMSVKIELATGQVVVSRRVIPEFSRSEKMLRRQFDVGFEAIFPLLNRAREKLR